MKNLKINKLTENETKIVSGGNGDNDKTNTEKAKDMVNDGMDCVQDSYDKIYDKIHNHNK